MKNSNPIYYTPRSRGRQFGHVELTDAQIKEWWDRVKDAPYNPRRDYDYQLTIGHRVHYRDGQFNNLQNQRFKNDKRKGG